MFDASNGLLFVARNDATRQRAISNGGLGGFVTIGSIRVMENQQGNGKATWPKNRKRRKDKPAPISIIQETDKFFVKQEIVSPTAESDYLPTPRTPVSRFVSLLSPGCAHGNDLPPPPSTPKQQLLPSALELPGSLLLPSQGFPQSNPPCTPARLPAPSRSNSEESDTLWTPAVSVSSTTDIEDDEMPKSFPPKHLPRMAKSNKSRNFSAPVSRDLGIGKPISAMGVDELLDELPQLNPEAIKAIWIPAMIKQHNRIKTLLQDAVNVRLEKDSELHTFGQALESLSQDAHDISHTYEKAIKSTESLVERDVKSCRDRLEVAENNLASALTTIDSNQQALRYRDETIQQLRYTVDDIVRVLGDFIQDHVPLSRLQEHDQGDVREVMQMLADYSNSPNQCDNSASRFLRIPEEHYMANIDALREAQLKTERFREVAVHQNQMISQQSTQLDERLRAYEKSMGVIAERSHEVKLLADDNRQMRKIIEEFETGIRVSRTTRAVQDELFRDQEAMQSLLKNTKAAQAEELQKRDLEITELRMKLGIANENALRGRADVKQAVTHTYAPLSTEDIMVPPPTLKERRIMSKAKARPNNLTPSQSMSALTTRNPKSQAPAIPERRQSANVLTRSIEQPSFTMMPRDITPQWSCGVNTKQVDQSLCDTSDFSPNYAPRPRAESLGHNSGEAHPSSGNHAVASAVVGQMLGTPIKFDPNKKLPNRPEPHYAIDMYSGENSRSMQDGEDWYQQQLPQAPKHSPTPAIIQRKRVLSEIREASVEDSVSENVSEKDTKSATSSAQEEYMNGLQAVRMRDFINQTNTAIQNRDKDGQSVPDYEGRDYYPIQAEPKATSDTGIARTAELVQSSFKHSQHAKVYETSQDGSSSTITTKKSKNSPLRDIEGIRVSGDPWLSPAHHR